MSADIGEAMGFVEALSLVKRLSLDKVIIKGDAKIVVDAINSSSTFNSSFGDYIEKCKEILRDSPNFSVVFVRRNANYVAHAFANCWVDPPELVARLLPLLSAVAINEFSFFKKKKKECKYKLIYKV